MFLHDSSQMIFASLAHPSQFPDRVSNIKKVLILERGVLKIYEIQNLDFKVGLSEIYESSHAVLKKGKCLTAVDINTRDGPISHFWSDTDIRYLRIFRYPIIRILIPISDTDVSDILITLCLTQTPAKSDCIAKFIENVGNQIKMVILKSFTIT